VASEPVNPFEHGPYLQLAVLCEKALREADGVLSLIRVVDRVTHTARGSEAPEEMPEVRYPLTLVITLKAGTARGRHEVTVTPELPSGEQMPPVLTTVQMEGVSRGVNIVSQIDIPFKLEGLYWFNILFDGVLLTRVPLEMHYSRMVTGSATEE